MDDVPPRAWDRRRMVFLAMAVLGACSDHTSPALDRTGEASMAMFMSCTGWQPTAPTITPILVDLRIEEGDASDVIAAKHRAAVTGAGGQIVREFNVSVIRARMDTAAARRMVTEGMAMYAVTVPDAASTMVQIEIFFTDGPTADDQRMVTSRGGIIDMVTPIGRRITARIPDAAIPGLRSQTRVTSVRAYMLGCVTVL